MITNDTQGFPHSDAQNAYDLLSDVCTVVTDEPKRLYMGVWGGTPGNAQSVLNELKQYFDNKPILDGPKCGTIGCVAGWCEALTGSPMHSAYQLLGSKISREFVGALDYLFNHYFPDDTQYGTLAYVEHVVRRVKAFQATWETHLRNTSVRTAQ